MKAFYVLAAAFAVIASAQAASLHEEHPIDWYDCSGKDDGNYLHPTDCTRFISCSGGVASQRDCANCHVDPVRCPEGRTVYNDTVDACLWADETACGGSPGPDPTDAPGPDPTDGPGPDPTDGPGPDPTDGPGPDPTTEGPGDGDGNIGLPAPGSECNPQDCEREGWCFEYRICSKEGKWEYAECSGDLIWNPEGSGSEHGGNCGHFENLSDEKKLEYWSHPLCLECFWKKTKNVCSTEYLYQAPNQTRLDPQTLNCEDDLVFDLTANTCIPCKEADDGNGGKCSC